MSQAKDFQRETANRIIEIFQRGRKRVLLSDEVGLGKTIIARTVIDLAKSLPRIKDDGIYRVVYVCSNQNIIRQNTMNLGISEDDIVPLSDSRLSMQHLILQERLMRDKCENEGDIPVQLIPLTPATSFSMTNGAGNIQERALMYAILKKHRELESKEKNLSLLLKTRNVSKDSGWLDIVKSYIYKVEQCGPDYYNGLLLDLQENNTFKENFPKLVEAVTIQANDIPSTVINKLRVAFAQVSLKRLEPDLVIMDEFQRFSGLLDLSETTEETMIAHEFFSDDHPYILLLSATPYKPFTTLEELNEENCDEQYQDFIKLMKFLHEGNGHNAAEFVSVWEDYSKKLSHISIGPFDALIASKRTAEEKMYDVMCRTERFSEGLIRTVPMNDLEITEGDILSYCQMQKLLTEAKNVLQRRNKISFNPSYDIPVEYVKSSPYLLSFMQNYQEWKTIKEAFDGKNVPLIKNSRSQRLLVKIDDVYNYKKIPVTNAKLDVLQKILFDKHAECLLWVPASHPYYEVPENNVFFQNKDFSKILVFSAWGMVPRMLAIMLSYESERLNINGAYKKITYTTRKKVGMNKLQEEGGELLKYRSTYLAGKFDYTKFMGKSVDSILDEIEKEIQCDIDKLGIPQINGTSAPLLLNLTKLFENEDVELRGIPIRAARTLAYMAVASPAVCFYRALKVLNVLDDVNKTDATFQERAVESIIAIFNRREGAAAVELSTPKTLTYYEQVLHYCVMGNLQSVLDEYLHLMEKGMAHETAQNIIATIDKTFIKIKDYGVETTLSFCKKNEAKPINMRRYFACDYAKGVADRNVEHNGTLQQAFNSPFRPFLLATTSVGQEGLDFHWYARKIVHWNLPSNPVDMEQREGRINRFKCLAIRRNVAKFFGYKTTWREMFEEADRVWRVEMTAGYSEMVPYWCLPAEIIKEYDSELEHIERLVPLYPMSIDSIRYEHLIDVLSLYRLTMGQPRQEELLQLLEGKVSPEQMKQLLFDLSPYSRNRNKV